MKVVLSPTELNGTVYAPPSKSCMHRALICAAASDSKTVIKCESFSKDTEATMACLRALGADFKIDGEYITVSPIDKNIDCECILDCNESGSTLRFMIPFAAALGRSCTFIGAERLGKRPLEPLLDALREHGITAEHGEDSFLPLKISGQLTGGVFTLPGDISSQFFTGILFALGIVGGGSIRAIGKIESAPYIDITADIQRQFGINVIKEENGYTVEKGSYTSPDKFTVEGDWSNGAFWLVAGAIGGGITCLNLREDTLQGDCKIFDILKLMGADIDWCQGGVKVKKSQLHAVEVDCGDIPDIVPVLCVAASAAEGVTVFKNIGRLRAKESDRVQTTADMLCALGGKITFDENTITVTGTPLKGGCTESFNDHRIAMSSAVASVIASGDVEINGAEAVAKSYPDFFEKFTMLGGKVR